MISLSRRRKESSTAFLTHWFTDQSPPFFSATRIRPASRSSSTCSTASFTPAGAFAGEISARFSNASSMVFCRLSISSRLSLLGGHRRGAGTHRHCALFHERSQPARRFDRILHRRNQRHPHHAAPRIHAVGLAADVAAGQDGHVGGGEELAREGEV